MSLLLSDYNYNLPENCIAQKPITPAHNSKLLNCEVDWNNIKLFDNYFYDLPNLLEKDSLLIANNSQVFESRIPLNNVFITLKTWENTILNKWEIFIVKLIFKDNWSLDENKCIIRWSDKKHFKPWSTIYFEKSIYWKSIEFVDDWILFNLYNINIIDLCKSYWDIPLPPYINKANEEDKKKYKTSFWKSIWSVATPTAWLHFTWEIRDNLKEKNIDRKELTLHVGIWTFAPVISEKITNHKLHSELIEIERNIFETIYWKKKNKQKIITIWTTSTRSVESLPFLWKILEKKDKIKYCSKECISRRDNITVNEHNISDFLLLISINSDNIRFNSALFIYPWFQRKIIDWLITNFHLPQTSLVMLIAWMIWYKNWKDSYYYAIQNNYRFASFGDAMIIQF